MASTDDLLLRDAALAAATNGIVIADATPGTDYPILYVNRGFERITGHAAEDVLGRNCRSSRARAPTRPPPPRWATRCATAAPRR